MGSIQMRLVYLLNSFIPSRAAHTIQVMKMCDALAGQGVEVFLLVRNDMGTSSFESLKEFYGIENEFEVHFLKTTSIPKLRALGFAFRVKQNLSKFSPDVVFSRDLFSSYLLSSEQYKHVFELHSYFDYSFNYLQAINNIKTYFFKRLSLLQKVPLVY